MHAVKTIAAFVMLAASAVAAPVDAKASTPNTASPSVIFTPSPADSINDCGASTFENKTSGASPTVADCLQIAANIGGGGSWNVEMVVKQQHQLVQYGTCAFGVQAKGGQGSWFFDVGNQDIIDLIRDSINQFQWNGLVGSKGRMGCQSDGGWADVEWGLYHN